jgi:hypothetical protein
VDGCRKIKASVQLRGAIDVLHKLADFVNGKNVIAYQFRKCPGEYFERQSVEGSCNLISQQRGYVEVGSAEFDHHSHDFAAAFAFS